MNLNVDGRRFFLTQKEKKVKKETGVFDKNICLSYNALSRKADR